MRYVFAAGGTGGHVFPALAVASALREISKDAEISFVGTAKGFETKLVPAEGFPLDLVNVKGLKGSKLLGLIRGLILVPRAIVESMRIIRRRKPEVVFGIGGYASGPLLLCAGLSGIPTAILEPNTVPGFSNRLLSRLARRVFLAFEETLKQLPKEKSVYTGNPIRKGILAVRPPRFDQPLRSILIFGGSQGAERLNEGMIAALPFLEDIKSSIRFVHQTGERSVERVRNAYEERKFSARVTAFIENMAEAYNEADFVIARSGSSVLEIAACGRPSILVPYPIAADDHQRHNARVLERAGAAIYIDNGDFTGESVARTIRELLNDIERLIKMRDAALAFRKDRAAEEVAESLRELASSCGERKAA